MYMFTSIRSWFELKKANVAAFRGDLQGIALTEFALILPLLGTCLIATIEISEAVTVNRKITQTVSTIADLVTQQTVLDINEMENIFDASSAVMSPYASDTLEVVIAVVGQNPTTKANEVMWSKARNTDAWAEGGPPKEPIPSGFDLQNKQIVVAHVQFTYKAVFGSLAVDLFGSESFAMEEIFFLRPRNSATIAFQ